MCDPQDFAGDERCAQNRQLWTRRGFGALTGAADLANLLSTPAHAAPDQPLELSVRPDGGIEYRFRKPDPTGRTSSATDGPSWCPPGDGSA